ncbi:hypothetical protein KKE14_00725 [Patescibacteria group bacterium]|nr:hypothetical protein [Patescibacteria group bacterium]
MFIELFIDFLRRYWWGVVAVIVLIVGGVWWYNDYQKIEVSGYKISPEAAIAVDYYLNGEIDKAQTQYELVVKNNPKDWFSWNSLANIFRDKEEFEKSEEAYLKAISIDRKFEQAYKNLYHLYYIWSKKDDSQFAKAEGVLLDAYKYLPKSEIILEELLDYYKRTENQEKFNFYEDKLNVIRNIRPSEDGTTNPGFEFN